MQPDFFDWRGGEVVYWDMDSFDATKPPEEQLDTLKEDLVQVRFGTNTLLDIGWYPEFSPEGRFVVTVIRNEDWDQPVSQAESRTLGELIAAITAGIRVAAG